MSERAPSGKKSVSETPPIKEGGKSTPARCWYALCWIVCWVVCKALFRFQYSGRGNVPMNGPLLVVSNHQSHLDPVLLGVACPRQLGALARASLFVGPFSWLISSLGAVPVERGSATAGIRAILGMLKAGAAMIVFPEGTRTHDGEVQPLQIGFCAIARRSGAAILPTTIQGAYDAFPRGKILPRLRPISLTFHPAITADEIARLTDEELAALTTERIDPRTVPTCTSAC